MCHELSLVGQAFDHILVGMAEVAHGYSGQEIEITPPVHVPEPAPFALCDANGEPVVGICQILLSLVNPLFLHHSSPAIWVPMPSPCKYLEEQGMGNPAVDDMRLLHPAMERIEAALDLWDHPSPHRLLIEQAFASSVFNTDMVLDAVIENAGYVSRSISFSAIRAFAMAPAAVSAFML